MPGHPDPLPPDIRCVHHASVPTTDKVHQLRPRDVADTAKVPVAERLLDEGELGREGDIGLAVLDAGDSGQSGIVLLRGDVQPVPLEIAAVGSHPDRRGGESRAVPSVMGS